MTGISHVGFGHSLSRGLVDAPEPPILRLTMSDRFHHNVYVILLDSAVAKERKVRALNPQRDAKKPCVYVGMTGIPPIERFQNHKDGYKASYYACKYGVRLLPDLYEYLNPMPYEAACQMEKDLAEDLREQGYTVCGGI
jgi:predicted GIY-YIG superfamily endonuclease